MSYPMELLSMPKHSKEAIKILSKYYKLGIVTGRIRRGVDRFFQFSKLRKYFDVVVSFEDYTEPKPNPESLLVALKRLRLGPKEAVYIGDSKSDVKAAKAANMKVIAYPKGIRGADFILRSFKDLSSAIDSIQEKFLIIGDLHGNKPKIHFKDFDAIITSGDFCSADEIRKYSFRALKERLQNPSSKIKWYDLIDKKEARKLVKKSLEDGREILNYLNSFNVPVYIVPGNADLTPDKEEKWIFLHKNNYKKLIEKLENIIDVHQKIVDTEEHQIIGYGISDGPEYPQYKEDLIRFKKGELKKKKAEYRKTIKKVSSLFEKSTKPIIFLSHNVPFNTPIDKIINKESPRNGWHYGSLVTRKIIEKYQPLVCIGGHMHENFGKCKIGKTVCINAGFGSSVNVLMELDKDKIVRLQFHKK
jgi:Icc-related predicted phosphoesterase